MKLDPNNIGKLWHGGHWKPRQFFFVAPDLHHVMRFTARPCLMNGDPGSQDWFYATVDHWFDDDPCWDNAMGLPIVYSNKSFAKMCEAYEGYELRWDCPTIKVKDYPEEDE